MKLFRVYWDSAVPSFLVQNPSGLVGVSGAEMKVESGNHLLQISMIVDMAERELRFLNGSETREGKMDIVSSPFDRPRTPAALAALAEWD